MSVLRGPVLVLLATALVSGSAAVIATPRVIMGVAIDRLSLRSGVNHMSHGDLATPENQPVVRPSPDLAYSSCPYDLTNGPLLIEVSPVAGRYSSLSIFDGRTDTIFVRNDLQAGGRPYRIILALPNHSVVDDANTVRTKETRGVALIRLLLRSPDELPKLQTARQLTTCRLM